MANLPSVNTTYLFCALAAISDGSDNYVCAKNYEMQWGYEQLQETVIGTYDPVMATGAFRGTVSFEVLASTELQTASAGFHDWTSPTSGVLAEKTFTVTETDSAAATKVWTVKVRFNNYREVLREDRFILVRITGNLTTEPTLV